MFTLPLLAISLVMWVVVNRNPHKIISIFSAAYYKCCSHSDGPVQLFFSLSCVNHATLWHTESPNVHFRVPDKPHSRVDKSIRRPDPERTYTFLLVDPPLSPPQDVCIIRNGNKSYLISIITKKITVRRTSCNLFIKEFLVYLGRTATTLSLCYFNKQQVVGKLTNV